ncbi:TonB-dependent receptor plug domain-containing protein [Pseudohalioglobus sediminis]|uniref:TonB-dependent receptor plug domain-containing protein n=1 Tax=Pseudohalioglobus sediminis TaxID=2606449 RepID=A0A5B0X3V9_9GAMM|nr:TonB-dependent receptor [Pseudohalioglobus sediminis]KAA1193395.1 TonB-dependent receptor plug domain-containing protein [Pseudohalioglobus sediminis]
MSVKYKLALAVAVTTVVSGSVSVHAREVEALRGDDFQLEEILVTARKKVENLQSVPVSIDAIGQAQLDEKAISSLADVAKYSSSLTFQTGVLPNDTRPSIRGVNITRGRPNVGILVDGIDISSETLTVAGGGAYANMGLLELERVEVIKGPQSVTYGRSAFAGAINYVTKRPQPGEGVYGYVEGEANEHGYWRGLGSVSFSVNEQLAMSLSALSSDFDGYYENPITGGDLGGNTQNGGSIALNFLSEGSFTAYLRGEYVKDESTPLPVVMAASALPLGSAENDFFLLGSVGENAEKMPIPGGARGLPEATPEECAEQPAWRYTVGLPPACATMLVGDISDVGEEDINLSPNPNTGRDYRGTEIENTRLSLELEWQMGEVDVLSLTGYTHNETSIVEDFDKTAYELDSFFPGSANFDPNYIGPPLATLTQFGVETNSDTSFDYDQFSQEFRFSGVAGNFEWMADLLYWAEDMDSVMNQMWWVNSQVDTDYYNSALSRVADPTCTIPGDVTTCELFTGVQTEMVPNRIPINRDTQHWSVAGSLVYNLGESWRFTAEGRYLEENIDYEGLPKDTYLNGLLNMPYFNADLEVVDPVMQKESVDETAFVPRFSADWQASDDVFAYASVGKGFKPGGIATTDGNGDITTGHYDPEVLWAYEIGVKTDLLGNRLRLNGAIFYNDYTDQQVPYFVRNELGITKVSITNAGESEIYGAEIEATYRPSENWIFFVGYTHVETEYTDFNISESGEPGTYDKIQSGNVEGDFTGAAFINTPEDVAVASIRYEGDFSNGWGYFTELFGNYRSKQYMDSGNMSYLGSVWIADFTAGLNGENWSLVAYVNNLADEDQATTGLGNVNFGYMPTGQVTPFAVNLMLPNPRTFGARFRYSF